MLRLITGWPQKSLRVVGYRVVRTPQTSHAYGANGIGQVIKRTVVNQETEALKMMRSILTRRGGRDVAQPITARPLERAQREKGTHGALPYRRRILLLVALASLVVLSAVSWHWLADWQRLWGAVQSIFASPAAFHQWAAGFGAWAP